MDLLSAFYLLLVTIGFGFVIFWHELGHFLAAKWAGVRVEQFAIGFGTAIVAWRKGLGTRFGTTTPEYEAIRQSDPERWAQMSPTEYRLNWVPLGGYVKMYGQEDMVAQTTSPDTDHYMNKSVGKRMVIISAGVVMNVILAAILFTVLFWWGYHPPAPMIGTLSPDGPAQKAGLNVGDTILEINGSPQYAWTNVGITAALLRPNEPANFTIQPAGTGNDPSARRNVQVTPAVDAGVKGMVGVGIGQTFALKGVNPRFVKVDDETLSRLLSEDQRAVMPGEEIIEIEGQSVGLGDYYVLHREVLASVGRPINIKVRALDEQIQRRRVQPRLFAIAELDDGLHPFAGLLPLVEVLSVTLESPAEGKLMPGDVIERIDVAGTADAVALPSFPEMKTVLNAAGQGNRKVNVQVRRGGERITLRDLDTTIVNPQEKQYGLGFRPAVDTGPAVIAGIADKSPAQAAGVPAHGTVVSVGGVATQSWFDVRSQLEAARAAGEKDINVGIQPESGAVQTFTLGLDDASLAGIARNQPVVDLYFVLNHELGNAAMYKTTLQTSNPLQAMWWGVRETRDQILNLYLTLKRVAIDQTVSPKNLTGPVGIFQFGTVVARNGPDWLIWFLAMISANLAVVNFLPIPILDGGHMVFLASEKVTGRPPSPKVQTAALYAGLLLIVGLVLFVTYNDLQRLLFL